MYRRRQSALGSAIGFGIAGLYAVYRFTFGPAYDFNERDAAALQGTHDGHTESDAHKERMLAKTNGWHHHVCSVPGDHAGYKPELPADIKVARFNGEQLSLVVTDKKGHWYVDQAMNHLGKFKVMWDETGCQTMEIGAATLVIPANGVSDLAMTGCGASVKISADKEVEVLIDSMATPCVLHGRTRKGNMNTERHTINAAIDIPDLVRDARHIVTAMEIAED